MAAFKGNRDFGAGLECEPHLYREQVHRGIGGSKTKTEASANCVLGNRVALGTHLAEHMHSVQVRRRLGEAFIYM